MKFVLSTDEAEILRIWANSSSPRIAKRAWLVLQFASGIHTKLIAQAVGMPEQRVLENIAAFEHLGVLGIFDMPRSGRRSKMTPELRIKIFDLAEALDKLTLIDKDAALKGIAKDFGISLDSLWRTSRTLGLKLARRTTKKLHVFADGRLFNNLIGLYISGGIAISAHIKAIETKNPPAQGFWDRPGPIALKEYVSNIGPESIDLSQALQLANLDENYPQMGQRQKMEQILRWLIRMDKFLEASKIEIKIAITGDFKSEGMFFCLSSLKNYYLGDGANRRLFEVIPNLSCADWMKNLMGVKSQKTLLASNIRQIMLNPNSQFVWYGIKEIDT